MKYLKKYENYLSADHKTEMYCDGLISESEFILYLDQLNENWFVDMKNWIIEKILKILYTLLQKSIELGSKITNKIINAINFILEKITKFRDKHPDLYKLIIITIILFLCFIVLASSAHAASTGKPIDTDLINAAIGKLKDMDIDSMLSKRAMAFLIDIRDGHQDISNDIYGQKTVDLANNVMSVLNKMKNSSDGGFVNIMNEYVKIGAQYIGAEISKMGGTETIKLFFK